MNAMQPNASPKGKTLTDCNIMIAVMLLTALKYFPLTNLLLLIMSIDGGFHCSQSWVRPCQLELTGKAAGLFQGQSYFNTPLMLVNLGELLACLVKASAGIRRSFNSMAVMRTFGDQPSLRAIHACSLQLGTFK